MTITFFNSTATSQSCAEHSIAIDVHSSNKSLFFVIGEQLLQPLATKIGALANKFFPQATAGLDKKALKKQLKVAKAELEEQRALEDKYCIPARRNFIELPKFLKAATQKRDAARESYQTTGSSQDLEIIHEQNRMIKDSKDGLGILMSWCADEQHQTSRLIERIEKMSALLTQMSED